MCTNKSNPITAKEITGFTYPVLHTGKSWYVDFTALDHVSGRMRRKKYMLDSIRSKAERRKRASEIIEATIRLLRAGWTPWVSQSDDRRFVELRAAFDKYEQFIGRLPRIKTRNDYWSRLNVLHQFLATLAIPPKYVYQFNTPLLSDFLDWLYLDRNLSARTRNNYRGWLAGVCAFFMQRQWLDHDPTDKIKILKETAKIRQPLTQEMLAELEEELRHTDPHFLLACRMEYYTFIRPKELVLLRIRDLDLDNASLFVPKEVSKNKRDGKVGLNDTLVEMFRSLGVAAAPGDWFIFGKGFRPAKRQWESQAFRRRWIDLRDKLGWGQQFQFYSLKDSGLRDLANSVGIVIARDQARHTDVSTTNHYLQGRDLPVHEEVKRFKGYI